MIFLKKIYYTLPVPIRMIRHDLLHNLKNRYWIVANCIYDGYLMARFSSELRSKGTQSNQKAKLIFYYHKIEKAMALPMPRLGFGKEWIVVNFIPLLKTYYYEYGYDDVVEVCCINLRAYIIFNKYSDVPLDEVFSLIEETLKIIGRPLNNNAGGTKEVMAKDIKNASTFDFYRFVNNRHSIRNFASVTVERDLVEKAIQMAQRTPSVCNRQPWHVYAFYDKKQIAEVLKHQNGNGGFSQTIQVLLVVAGDLSSMISSSERNEIWVDGGMFSMSLVYSLHSLGLGTCCLNLCLNVSEEIKLKRKIKMQHYHRPVMMVAVGHIPDKLTVAHSQRKSVKEVLTWD